MEMVFELNLAGLRSL